MNRRASLRLALTLAGLWFASVVVVVAADVPAPYAGMKNPFAWTDTSVQQAGQKVYQSNCMGCHGATGGNVPSAKFNDSAYPKNLEAGPDFYFWTLSEGRLTKGMPPYKSSLSEDQRWQVLTYLRTLAPSGPATPPAAGTGTAAPGNYNLELSTAAKTSAVGQSVVGQPITLTVVVKDDLLAPVAGATVTFQQEVDFFATGKIDIGETTTDSNGTAQLTYTPRSSEPVTLLAAYAGFEGKVSLTVADAEAPVYQTHVGIDLPSAGPNVWVGPSIQDQLASDSAPTAVFRLTGGIFSMLWIPILVIALIWFTYFRVMYQVFRIPQRDESGSAETDTNTRLLPTVGLVIIVFIGLLLLFMFGAGPYSQFHI